MKLGEGILIRERIRALGLEYTGKLCVAAGTEVSLVWWEVMHRQPHRVSAPKTSGIGPPHMLCIYPFDWQDRIDAIIRKHATGKTENQAELF